MISVLDTDLLVIGFGKGGKTLAATLGTHGRRVILVEQSAAMYGGTCINTGCVPTKSMVHQGESGTEYAAAVAATEQLTAGLRATNLAMLDAVPDATVLTGRAHFLDSHTVEVSTETATLTVTARTIIIGTGSEPVIPDIPGLRECPVTRTSDQLLHQAARPDRLAILGGGYIGLEFASMYASFGSEVTVLEQRPTVLGHEDPEIADAARTLLADRGVALRTRVDIVGVQTILRPGQPPVGRVEYLDEGSATSVEADNVLIAMGRAPNTAGLGLDRAGVEVTDTGAVVVDDFRRTSQSHIFAVGDVNGGPQFTYISLDDHRIVADQLSGAATPRSADDRVAVPNCLFLSPPLARVGLTESQARNAGYRVRVAVSPVVNLATVARARIVGDTKGIMKVVVDDATDQILGAALLCHDAQEIINIVALAMRHGITAAALRDEIYTHPSMAECFNQLLGMLR
ncbi:MULTISPECIES: FAD-dependent oxidoreductase [Mycolicibacterium]|jgi:pyruvate/2-oxoglutarate dehydrogenase complex dihydrolipoamide dehydrogenase (E3) component|uniref:Pyridine nucleotide-disulfide oxidoreductase family protein n=1 Tax=Mycolicibacterium smegmatis (strain MKD8) TaxID=1214915 RepID=A0A2U9PU38_MYCSE|nr:MULTISPECIES: FAD-dependent oxidoreductase [Mycolicibacterium]AWT55322.1 pyridine nucleotide-disulfide oxidoreductase family protein [Mycolicibacterium smegmatis MKD8]OKH73566.1 pyridine nucleotide-disulfide oxidoreductase [Mycobacterium sp. SWH-M5]PJK22455.1 pyridine nucleotide-disulfide oxidoreductase [Mycolicibacterium goodii]